MKHHILKHRLKKRGWSEEEIARAFNSFLKAEEKKHPLLVKFDKILGWIALIITIIINFVVCLSFIPLYLTMPTVIVILCVGFLGFCFGVLIDIFVRDIDYWHHHHYILAGVFLPSVSVITVYYTIRMSNIFSVFLPAARTQNPYLISFVYVLCFMLPHGLYKYFEIKEYMLKHGS